MRGGRIYYLLAGTAKAHFYVSQGVSVVEGSDAQRPELGFQIRRNMGGHPCMLVRWLGGQGCSTLAALLQCRSVSRWRPVIQSFVVVDWG